MGNCMYHKELFQKAAGVTIACLLTIGLNAALSDTGEKNVGKSADTAQTVVISSIEDSTEENAADAPKEEEVVEISAKTVQPMEEPYAWELPEGAPIIFGTAADAPAVQNAPSVAKAAQAEQNTGVAQAEQNTSAVQAGQETGAAQPEQNASAAQAGQNAAETQAETTASAETQVSDQFQDMAISIAGDYVNIRKEPNTDSDIKGKLYQGSAAKILKTKGDWVKITSGSVTGYIRKDYLAIGAEAEKLSDKYGKLYATVKKGTETLNVRQEKSTEADIVTQLDDGDSHVVKGEAAEWVKIKVGGETGYVAKEYVSTKLRFGKAVSIQEEQAEETESSSSASQGSSIASYALQFVGNPYVWGGTSLTNGADCSGFTMSVYAHFGYGLPHSSASQSGCGRSVSLSDLQPGDLVFYRHGGSIGHVAMYIGGGRVVHAQCARTGITTSSVYYNTPACARRIIG